LLGYSNLNSGLCGEITLNVFKHNLLNEICLIQGDSGGPLVQQGTDGKWTVIGVISFSDTTCLRWPTVTVNVAYFLDFIKKTAGIS
jgi:secreted trypsin-like serine protease